jgi:hypothetical protein
VNHQTFERTLRSPAIKPFKKIFFFIFLLFQFQPTHILMKKQKKQEAEESVFKKNNNNRRACLLEYVIFFKKILTHTQTNNITSFF